MGILSDASTREVFVIVWGLLVLVLLVGIAVSVSHLGQAVGRLRAIESALSGLERYVRNSTDAAIDSSQTLKSIDSTLSVMMRNNR